VSVAAFGGGLVLAESSARLALLAAAALGAVLAVLRAPRLAACAAVLLLAGVAAGGLRLAALDRPAERIHDGELVDVRAHLLTAPRPGAFGSSAEVEVAGGRLRGTRLLARATTWSPLPRSIAVGDELLLKGRLRELRPGASAARSRDPPFDYAAYLRRRGVAAEFLLDRARRTGRRRSGLAGALDRMRERAQRAVVAGMPAGEAALLRGMVLGEDERIDEATRDDWRDAGLAHLLAVSGQNVMLLAALALPLLMLAGLGLRTRLVALAALIALYVPLAGAGPSLQRAGVMGLAGIAAMAASRPASRWYALLLAATVTLAWNPRAWGDPGWQLSFAAVAGILMLGVPLQRALRAAAEELGPTAAEELGRERGAGHDGRAAGGDGPAAGGDGPAAGRDGPAAGRNGLAAARTPRLRLALLHAFTDGVAITVAATLATAPLLAHHFGSVPLAGLPANLLALPAVAPAMWLGMLKTALGQLATPLAPAPVADGASIAAAALGRAASLPVGYLAGLGERFADMPGGRLPLPLGSPRAVAAAYAALALAPLAAHRASTRLGAGGRLPLWAATWRGLPRTRRRALQAALVAAALVAATVLLSGPGAPRNLTVRFLDVGQGDAVLIQHPDGTAVLFDGGPPEGGVTRLLRRSGVERLALVVATHASRDHHGGLPAVLRRFEVDTLLDGGDATPDPSFHALLSLADERGVRRVRAIAPRTLTLAGGDLRIRVLSPPPRPPGPAPEDPNPRAVVAIVSSGGFDLMLSADAESVALLPLALPDVDAIKVPHHGSSDPGLPAVLERLRPEVAGIEVGRHNTYGHPAPSTLAALHGAGVPTYRTDRDGTVTLTVDRGEMKVQTER
jgi:competence protein ComEC